MTEEVKLPSNRNFGFVFFVVFLIVAFYPLISGSNLRIWSLIISLIFLSLGLINSKTLTPLNKLWFKFGIFLGKIISPIIMGFIFFFVLTPTGLLLRLFNKDILKLKTKKDKTYWIFKDNKNNSMKNQF